MARRARLADGEGNPSANNEHNVEHRREAVTNSLEQLYQLDKKIKALTERHLTELRKQKSDIKSKLKNDYQMTAPMVNARYYPYRIERQAEDAEDQVTLDGIREAFNYLPVGGSVDLAEAAGGGSGEKPAAAAAPA